MIETLAAWWDRMTGIEAWILIFGLVAQSMFFMRFLVQWLVTEKARRSVIPSLFWYFSLAGSILMFSYGILREDAVIIAGQAIGYVIYTRNIYYIRRDWLGAYVLPLVALAAIVLIIFDFYENSSVDEAGAAFALWWERLVSANASIAVFGFFAQGLFYCRFIVQWVATERRKLSVVPELFWYFSITGGLLMFTYGVFRTDPVIMIGQSTGIFIYSRNLWFIWKEKRENARTAAAD